MAKYSTGSDTEEPGECELCGESASTLTRATVAGAKLHVCPSCADHDDAVGREDDSTSRGDDSTAEDTSQRSASTDRTRQASRDTTPTTNVGTGDSTRWETEGTNYDTDQLPYLVADYDDRAREAREAAGLGVADLAADLDADEADVRAIEEGRASRADVGGSLVRDIEERLDVTLAE